MIVDIVGDEEVTWLPPPGCLYTAVVGSRRRDSDDDREQVLRTCMALLEWAATVSTPVAFVSGGCRQGADRTIELIVEATKLVLLRFLPAPVAPGALRWTHTRALHARNTRIVTTAHQVLAQVAPDRTGGTEDAVKKAHRLGRPVLLLRSDGTCAHELPPVSKRRTAMYPFPSKEGEARTDDLSTFTWRSQLQQSPGAS